MVNNEIIRKLKSVNWNFDFNINYKAGVLKPFNCRKYYSYPATFIPEIPYTLIEILSKKGDVVVDPFGGIGTTFMQALLLERNPMTFDINITASNVCETLFRLFDSSIDYDELKDSLLALPDQYVDGIDYTTRLSSYRIGLSGWYEATTFNELAFLATSFDVAQDDLYKSVLGLVLSSLLTTLSSQNKGWAYIADNVKPKVDEFKRKEVFRQYRIAITSLLNDISSYASTLKKTWDDFENFYNGLTVNKRIFSNSILSERIEDNTVDLIVTSPPYPKMIDYIKSQRLAFSFYETDFHTFMSDEIGARYRRSRGDAVSAYVLTMKAHIEKMQNILKHEGFLCLVLPDYDESEKEQERRKAITDLVNYCFEIGFRKVDEIGRYIPSHKRTLSIQWATLVNERIYIFQKG